MPPKQTDPSNNGHEQHDKGSGTTSSEATKTSSTHDGAQQASQPVKTQSDLNTMLKHEDKDLKNMEFSDADRK